jgi:phosphoglycerate dehydrogenase-like enzyme
MRILYNDILEMGLLDFVATPVRKDELYREADVVSLHVPLTWETTDLINERELTWFKPGAVLINTARGAVVNSDALARALNRGALMGAALDVTYPEPLPPGHPLLVAPHTVFTPHLGARTPGSLTRMNAVVEDVIRVLEGETPEYPAGLEDEIPGG